MQKLLLIAFLATFTFTVKGQNKPYCNLHGSVYETSEKQGADFWVYEEESEAFADLIVFEEENQLYADQPGVWFFVENKGLADFSIYFTTEKSEADFILYFTDSSTFAGCKL